LKTAPSSRECSGHSLKRLVLLIAMVSCCAPSPLCTAALCTAALWPLAVVDGTAEWWSTPVWCVCTPCMHTRHEPASHLGVVACNQSIYLVGPSGGQTKRGHLPAAATAPGALEITRDSVGLLGLPSTPVANTEKHVRLAAGWSLPCCGQMWRRSTPSAAWMQGFSTLRKTGRSRPSLWMARCCGAMTSQLGQGTSLPSTTGTPGRRHPLPRHHHSHQPCNSSTPHVSEPCPGLGFSIHSLVQSNGRCHHACD
jgi:hypothetical protein